MKRIITLFTILLATSGISQNTMTISSATVSSEQTFEVNVSITNDSLFVAFQFDLPVPTGFSYIANSITLNPVRANGHILESELLTGNILRVMAYSQTNNPFLGDTGKVVAFQLKSGTVPGSYPLELQSAVIGDTNSVNVLTNSVNGTVIMQAPDIHTTQSLIDFDRTPLGQTTDRNFTIYNNGNLPLSIQNITFTSTYFTIVGSSTFNIPANQNSTVQIRFTSVVKGVYDKVMTILSNDPDEPSITVDLHSRAYAVNELHTGNMFAYSGHGGTLSFTINNMEPFTGFQFDLQLPQPLTYVSGSAILSSRKTNHVVSADMVSGNKLRAVAHSPDKQTFTGTGGQVLTLSFTVSGVGGSYPLNLSDVVIGDTLAENSLSDHYNGTLQIAAGDIFSSTTVAFGNVSVLETGQKTLRVYNYGTDTLKIEQVTFTNPSYALGLSLPLNILTFGYIDFPITFNQSTEGQSDGVMKIFSNDPDEYPYLVNLSAFAYIPNYMIIPDLEALYIDTVEVQVKVNSLESFVGFQFDLTYPDCISYISGSAQLTGRAQGHLLQADTLDSLRVRVFAYSLTQTPFSGDTGAVVTLSFAVHALNGDTSATLAFDSAVLGNALSQDILWGTDNGVITIHQPHVISGTYTYNNNANTPLDSLWVFLHQNDVKIDSTRLPADGSFSFLPVFNGTYTVSATTQKPWGGVNGTDALKLQRHFVGLEPFTIPIRITAADVNASGGINGTDALKIKRRFIGLDTSFTRGDWTFERQSGGDSILMTGANLTINFYGLCVGDVNGSHTPSIGAKSTYDIELTAEKVLPAGPGQELYLPIAIDREADIGSFSLVLDYPDNLITLEEVSTVKGNHLFLTRAGKLRAVWAELNPIRAYTSEPIAFIKVKTSETFGSGSTVQFQNASNLTEFSDRYGNPIKGLTFSIPTIRFSDDLDDRSLYIFPNPARQYTSLIFRVSETGTVKLTVYDLMGRKVERFQVGSVTEGLNKVSFPVTNLRKGEYILELQFIGVSRSYHQTGRLVVGI